MSDIRIVGAGITGPSAALSLMQAGHNVTVYEQRPSDGLYSAGILGITRGNWETLVKAGVPLNRYELGNEFMDYAIAGLFESPFRLIAWVDLHNALTQTAQRYGAEFVWETRVNPDTLDGEYVLDAGGIFSASKRLASRYSGYAIYRGTSPLDASEGFTVYRGLPYGGYYTEGQTNYGASWALFVARPEPMHHRTVATAEVPGEVNLLPVQFQRHIHSTTDTIVSYMSDWDVPRTAHDASWRRFTLGDANGPVRPVTTSGANLAVIAGMQAPTLVSGDHRAASALQRSLLNRRRYDIMLGSMLESPEIGGMFADPMFAVHHSMLFKDGER